MPALQWCACTEGEASRRYRSLTRRGDKSGASDIFTLHMIYCKSCVMPSTRPGLRLDADGICSACRWHEQKKTVIDWSARRQELQRIADEAKAATSGPWHCVVGVSGGKDS